MMLANVNKQYGERRYRLWTVAMSLDCKKKTYKKLVEVACFVGNPDLVFEGKVVE